MLTKDDKKFVSNEISGQIGKALKKNNQILVKEMIGLFSATNSRIDEVNKNLGQRIDKVNGDLSEKIDDTNERIDKVLSQLNDDDESINDHERRIEKVEEKVFPISA